MISFYLNWTWAYHLRLSASAVFSLFYRSVIQTKKNHWALTKCQALSWALEILSAENRPRNPAFTDLTFRLGSEWQRQTIKISLLIHTWCCLNEMKWRSMFNNERNRHLHLRKWSQREVFCVYPVQGFNDRRQGRFALFCTRTGHPNRSQACSPAHQELPSCHIRGSLGAKAVKAQRLQNWNGAALFSTCRWPKVLLVSLVR